MNARQYLALTALTVSCVAAAQTITVKAKAGYPIAVHDISIGDQMTFEPAGTSTSPTVNIKQDGNTTVSYRLDLVGSIVYTPVDPTSINPAIVPDLDKFYYPGDPNYTSSYQSMFNTESSYNFKYCRQSEHFFVFWDKRFGDDPARATQTWARVDVDDLLLKAEQFFHTNIEVLGMAELGVGRSNLDKYKMQIWLIYDNGWVATGSGYGDVVGALWVTPSTCKPVGSTIAHEIGHSFQYQVYADKLANGDARNFEGGFRYGWGGNGGCTYWEQCAQWQSFQDYPAEAFAQDFNPWLVNYHRHFCHEWMRYQSYWLQSYWVMQRGIEAFGRIWRESRKPEDPIQTYTRLYLGGDVQAFWDEYYDYAARMVTYDIDNVRQYRNNTWGSSHQYNTALFEVGDREYQVAYSSCPETAGFNIIRLNAPYGGGEISVDFTALPVGSALAAADPGQYRQGDDGAIKGAVSKYNANTTNKSAPDFRVGFVSIAGNRAYYGTPTHTSGGIVTYTVPSDADELYMVVVPTPAKYTTHAWDVNDLTDEQWPYKFKTTGTNVYGHVSIDTTLEPHNVEMQYTVYCNASHPEYPIGTIDLKTSGDIESLAQAFVMQPTEIAALTSPIMANTTGHPTEGTVVLGLKQPDGSITYNYTANLGFYVKPDGSVGSWGQGAPVYVEYDKDNMVITYGHKPGETQSGNHYTASPCLVYIRDGQQYTATFNIKMQF